MAIARIGSAHHLYPANSITFTVTAGSFLICVTSLNSNTCTDVIHDSSVNNYGDNRDSQNNLWTSLAGYGHAFGPADVAQRVFYAANCAGGSTTIALSGSGSDRGLTVLEYTGIDTTSPVSAGPVNTAYTSGPGSPAVSSAITCAAGDLLLALYADEGVSYPDSVGYGTLLQADTIHYDGQAEYLVPSSNSYTPSFVLHNVSSAWIITAVAFKAASGGGGGSFQPAWARQSNQLIGSGIHVT